MPIINLLGHLIQAKPLYGQNFTATRVICLPNTHNLRVGKYKKLLLADGLMLRETNSQV